MAGSPGGTGSVGPSDAGQATAQTHPATEAAPTHPPTHPPTQVLRYGPGVPAAKTPEVPGAPGAPGAPGTLIQAQTTAGLGGSAGRPQEIVRRGPGVPAAAPSTVSAPQAGPTAEQVWRAGLPAGPPRQRRRLFRRARTALSVALLIASVVVIYLRLHHGPFGVTGVAITQETKNGCAVDVTGRITTTGAAGIVSYQWVFKPQAGAPQPQNQSVASGQSAVYVTAAVEGEGHGSIAQTVTLQVLGPGRASASANVIVSC